MPDGHWPRYTWDAAARQYRGEGGRFVARSEVKRALGEVIDAAADDIRKESERLQRGETEIADWQLATERSLKTIHTAATAIACGGWAQASPADWAECARRLRYQYGKLRDFAIELENGLPLDGRFLARAASYGRSAHGTYEAVNARGERIGGANWARRHRHAAHSCEPCVGYEAEGWVPIGRLVLPQEECDCASNCLCTVEYSRSVDHPEGLRIAQPGPPVWPDPKLEGLSFTRSARSQREKESTVIVDVAKLDEAWQKDKGYYVGPGGTGKSADPGKYKVVQRFIADAREDGTPVEQSEVNVEADGSVSFRDGRHRFAVFRDDGVRALPVSVPRSQAARTRRLYGIPRGGKKMTDTRGRAWSWVAGQAWAIEASALRTILSIAERTNPDPKMVEAALGRPLDNTHEVSVRDGVATIPVRGPISRYAGLMSEISGSTSVEQLAQDLRTAVEDEAVHSIILTIDSPGGQANGIGELAGMIREASERKPVVAYASGYMCSAAYWIGCACGEIVTAETGVLGSIGCVLQVPLGEDDEEEEFISSQSPNKRPDPSTEGGRAEIQRHVDEMAQIFIDSVAEYRDLEPSEVVERFGRGGMRIGRAAVEAGMADRVGTYEGLLAELAKAHEDKDGAAAVSFPIDRGGRATATSSTDGKKTMKLNIRALLGRWNAAGRPEEIDVDAAEPVQEDPVDVFLKSMALPVPAPAAPAAAKPDASLKAMERKAQKKALEMVLVPQAKAWIAEQVKAGRVAPAAAEEAAQTYLKLAIDDAMGATTHLAVFRGAVEARPAVNAHQTREFVPQDASVVQGHMKREGLKLFDNGSATPADAEREQSLSRVEQMLQGSDLGRQALAAAK